MALTDLIKDYRVARSRVGYGMTSGRPYRSSQEAGENALRTQLAQLQDAQVSARAAIHADDAEAGAKAEQTRQAALIRALAAIEGSANSASARRFAAALGAREKASARMFKEIPWYITGSFNEFQNQIINAKQNKVDSPNMHRALQAVMEKATKRGEKDYILRRTAQTLGVPESKLREELTKSSNTATAPAFKAVLADIDRNRTGMGNEYNEASDQMQIAEGRLRQQPGTSYGGRLIKLVQSMGSNAGTEEEQAKALEDALELIPTATNLIEETERQIAKGRSLSQYKEEIFADEDFQWRKKINGFDDDNKFLNYLIRNRRSKKVEAAPEEKIEIEESEQSMAPGDNLATLEGITSFDTGVMAELEDLLGGNPTEGNKAEAHRLLKMSNAKIEERMSAINAQLETLMTGGVTELTPEIERLAKLAEALDNQKATYRQHISFMEKDSPGLKRDFVSDPYGDSGVEESTLEEVDTSRPVLGELGGVDERSREEISEEFYSGPGDDLLKEWRQSLAQQAAENKKAGVSIGGTGEYPDKPASGMVRPDGDTGTASALKAPAVKAAAQRKSRADLKQTADTLAGGVQPSLPQVPSNPDDSERAGPMHRDTQRSTTARRSAIQKILAKVRKNQTIDPQELAAQDREQANLTVLPTVP
tara:strand:+ start:4777 stop:6729 length:1953 start_codon:yes stop_codon:yes gene_type:complete